MSARNSDASYLTERKRTMNNAYFFNRQTFYGAPTANPQTGNLGATRMPALQEGILRNVYRTGGPLLLVDSPSCACDAPNEIDANGLPNAINRN
jgi:hypothetical protein